MQRDLGGADVLPVVLTGNHEAWRGVSGIRMCRVRIEYLAPHACPEYEDEAGSSAGAGTSAKADAVQ